MNQIAIPELLRRLSRQTLAPTFLGTVNGSDIYQVREGWQKEILASDTSVKIALNSTDFENAVVSANINSIFVPHSAALTQEIAERILLRNPLSQTIYWEARE